MKQRSGICFLFFVFCMVVNLTVWAGFLVTQPEADKFHLAFCPAVGSHLVYYVNSTANMTAGKDFLGQDISLNASAAGEIHVFVNSVGIKDCEKDDFIVICQGRDRTKEDWEYNYLNIQGGFFKLRSVADFDKDLVCMNGTWVRAPLPPEFP